MLKVWGRKTSSNVQKVMWAIGELGLEHERVDIGGPFGRNKEPAYLAINPNGLVPTLEDGDLIIWESNTIVRYLAGRHGAGSLEPADPGTRARASQWMDWQLTVVAPAIFGAFWGLIRTPPEQREQAAIATSQAKTTEAMKIFETSLPVLSRKSQSNRSRTPTSRTPLSRRCLTWESSTSTSTSSNSSGIRSLKSSPR